MGSPPAASSSAAASNCPAFIQFISARRNALTSFFAYFKLSTKRRSDCARCRRNLGRGLNFASFCIHRHNSSNSQIRTVGVLELRLPDKCSVYRPGGSLVWERSSSTVALSAFGSANCFTASGCPARFRTTGGRSNSLRLLTLNEIARSYPLPELRTYSSVGVTEIGLASSVAHPDGEWIAQTGPRRRTTSSFRHRKC